jgi:hypothetical protein
MQVPTYQTSRRDWLKLSGLSSLAAWCHPLSLTAQPIQEALQRSGKQAILVWLDGGPTHLETWDPKREVSEEVRGPFGTVKTPVAGVELCELLPNVARQFRDWTLIRSVTSPLGEHNFGTHYLLTGYKPTPAIEYPALGGWLSTQRPSNDLPAHISIPRFRVGGARFSGYGFLDSTAAPFSVGGDPAKDNFRVEDLTLSTSLPPTRLERRQLYLDRLEQLSDSSQVAPAVRQAFKVLLSAESQQAFDLTQESGETRSRFGLRTVGQSCLLARRLIERDVPFVTVVDHGWDTHDQAYTRLKEGFAGARVPVGKIPSLDLALSGLVDDLKRLDRLSSTLIIVMGEFGRTPKLNANGGRDHWPRCFSIAMAGGGLEGGRVIGSSDRHGESPLEQPVTPSDVAYSILKLLGVDPRTTVTTPDGRPIALNRDGQWIEGLT